MAETEVTKMELAKNESGHEAGIESSAWVEEFTALYKLNVDAVFYYLASRLNSVQEAEDLTSLTFLSALEKYAGLRDKSRFRPWLFTIARNKLADKLRNQYKSPVFFLEDEYFYQSPDLSSQEIDRLLDLQQLIGLLKPTEQDLIRLRLIAELPFVEIAQILKKPETLIKKAYYRLLKRIQFHMED